MNGTRILAVIVCAWLATGCGTIYLDVPNDSNVKLLAKDAPAEYKVQRTVWYWMWGNRYLNENQDPHAWTLVEENGFKEVRLRMTNTFVDGLISAPGALVSICRRTIVVEGNK